MPKFWKGYIQENLVKIQNKYEVMLRHIALLHDLFQANNIEYVVFKTYRPYMAMTFDIDVLVDNYRKAFMILKRHGWKVELRHILLKEVHLVKDHMTLDLHEEIQGINKWALSNNRKLVEIGNYGVAYIPQDDVELLTVLSNAIADHQLTLGDVHYVRGLAQRGQINWKRVFNMGCQYGISSQLKNVLGIIRLKDVTFYNGEMVDVLPVIQKADIPIKGWSDPIVGLGSWWAIERRFPPLALLFREIASDSKRIAIKTIEKIFDKDLEFLEG